MSNQGGQRGYKRAQKPVNPFQVLFGGRGAAAATQPSFVPIASDQLPAGAFMRETGQVGGMSSEDAGRLGGYMDEMGRVFVPRGMGSIPPAPKLPAPVVAAAGTVQPGAIVSGLTPAGTVDYSQGDEYKAQMAQYRDLIAKKKEQEAEDLGMKIWMEKYGKSGLGLTGPNPLMKDFGGFIPTQGPTPIVLQTDESLKNVKSFFPGAGPEAFNPLDAQEQQQEATANQADMATTVKLPIRNRVQAFLQGGM